jgi:hypothetical protein
MISRDSEKTKDMMTVGELKAILQKWSDDTPVAVSIDNKTKPMNIKRTGMLAMNLYKNPDILTASLGLFLWKDEDYKK